MKISELTKQLNQIQLGHGDLICEVNDGLDPSDPAPVKGLTVMLRESNHPKDKHEFRGPVLYIES